MVTMSPIVEKRKKSSVGGRKVNGLHRISFVGSGHLRLAGASPDGSAVSL